MRITFLRSQEIGYALLQAEKQRIESELREFVGIVLKDSGADLALKWEFNPATLTFTVKDNPEADGNGSASG